MHAGVTHGDAVADAGEAEKLGPSAARVYTFLDESLQVAHSDMAGDQIRKTRSYPDERFFKLGPGHPRSE
jgi:hypothetical protein